ncbi:iron complex outermembrane receptor protein [Pseudoduganella lurida]|uniref:Iron complex outermembrane receptor protein n=1 Tax=Pseudoduganella lurida TaxID=1036180 RepID=A0A562QYA7_9BURK|nr:TonB-dependent receptor [Pseudoduganella lurida]TWI61170.1 iron complex outermembrane receptor protein [Pseudoduganella lurida]
MPLPSRRNPSPVLKPLTLLLLQAFAGAAIAAPEPEPAAPDAPPIETVFVQGQGRQVQNITRKDLVQATPGTSPLKTLEKLPGVSFQSADPFGAYEWSTHISIRGFNQNQLGFTLDGIPLGDMSYRNSNGLHISRAISSENVGSVTVSQGTGALATASTGNLGGTVAFTTRGPSDTASLQAAQTFGSDDTSRTFARIDTGLLSTGTKAYLSLTRQRADKWKGQGSQDQDQFNAKIEQQLGDQASISAFFNYSERDETDYQDLSFDATRRLGHDWDNYAPDWQRAVNAANGIYTGGVNNLDDAYYLGRGIRHDWLTGVALDWTVAEGVSLNTTVYGHRNHGESHWYTPYTPSSATVPISIRAQEYGIERAGIVSDLSWELASHTVTAGLWYERSTHGWSRAFYAVAGDEDTDRFLDNPFSTVIAQRFTTKTKQFYLQDSFALLDDRLKLNYGFKSSKATTQGDNDIGGRAAGTLEASKHFLPQAGLTFSLTPNDELFTSWARNMHAYQPGADGPFSQTQAAFDLSKGRVKPETSTTVDLGIRSRRGAAQGSLALYAADFKDRQLNVATCTGIVGCPTVLTNVGKVATRGVEAALDWKLSREWAWFNSFTYNHSEYKDAPLYYEGTTAIDVNGKRVVDAPRVLFNTELSFEHAGWFARTEAKYTGKRYYTYLNDSPVPSYWIGHLAAGYKLGKVGPFREATVQLNVTNLGDKEYFGAIGTNGFASSDPAGTFATMLTGAPRAAFISLNGKL